MLCDSIDQCRDFVTCSRKFFGLHVVNKSQLAEQALHWIVGLYEVERQALDMSDEDRWRMRQEMAVPIIKTLHEWIWPSAIWCLTAHPQPNRLQP